VAACLTTVQAAPAQDSPYADHTQRQIKALSPQEIEDYLEGRGMGFALPAELNGYPGPKHVMELADSLGLSEAQREATAEIFNRMRDEAQRLGAAIVRKEGELDSLFAARGISVHRLRALTAELGALKGELRAAHLAAHLAMTDQLTEHQRHEYARLRGYGSEHGRH
jgi:Spy/CpxP family protein refolding chaperone